MQPNDQSSHSIAGPVAVRRRTLLAAGAAVPLAAAAFGDAPTASAAPPMASFDGSTRPGMPLWGLGLGEFHRGSNNPAWLRYARVNIARVWVQPDRYVVEIDPGDDVTDLASFEARVAQLRQDPTSVPAIDWADVRRRLDTATSANVYSVAFVAESAVRWGFDLIVQASSSTTGAGGTWQARWQDWQRYYVLSHIMGHDYGVRRYSGQNEPDVPGTADKFATLDNYLDQLRVVSDAVRAGTADGTAAAGEPASALVHGPVITRSTMNLPNDEGSAQVPKNLEPNLDTTGYYGDDDRDDEVGWGEAVLKGLFIDHAGRTVTHPIIDVWDTHSYNTKLHVTPDFYQVEMDTIRDRMAKWAGVQLPVVYTEINIKNTWTFTQIDETLDSMELARQNGDIALTAANAGTAGLVWFRMHRSLRPDGDLMGTGFYYLDQRMPFHNVHSTKAAEVLRLAGRALGPDVTLIGSAVSPRLDGLRVQASYDSVRRLYNVYAQADESGARAVRVNVASLAAHGPRPGSEPIAIESVDEQFSGGVRDLVTRDRAFVELQLPTSGVARLTIPDRSVTELPTRPAVAAAMISQAQPATPLGGDALTVRRSTQGDTELTFLAFDLSDIDRSKISRALLQLHGSGEGGGIGLWAMALPEVDWTESTLTWDNAPALDDRGQVAAPDDEQWVGGQLTIPAASGPARLDITDVVRDVEADRITVVLVIHARTDDDTSELDRRAACATRSAPQEQQPQLRLWGW